MSFQTRDLWMLALGLTGDSPPSGLQPPLPDGIHLRWAFDPARGFPWYGYYLFRRRSAERHEPICVSTYWSKQGTAAAGTSEIGVGFGTLTSDASFTFTQDFPPPTSVEVDLDHRRYVRYETPTGEPIRWAELSIGFRKREGGGGSTRECVDFRRDQPRQVPNPLLRGRATFSAFDHAGQPRPSGRVASIGGAIGWDAGYRAEIKLPCPARRVEVALINFTSANRPSVRALDETGAVVDKVTVQGSGQQLVTLTGAGIVLIEVTSPQNETLVLQICWECGDGGGGTPRAIRVTARWEGGVVATQDVTGAPGSIQSVQLAGDAIDEIEIGPGQAALIELCVVPVHHRLGQGWQAISGFRYPLCLPVPHADYPCPGKPATNPAAEALALGRISYGPPGTWAGASFASIRSRLQRLVVGGPPPGGLAMNDRFEPVAGTPAPPPEAGGSITQQRQKPLDLLLLGSLHPAVAQMLGLYFHDSNAAAGTSYDYLLLADHDGSLGGTAASALAWIANASDFSIVDGVIVFDKTVAPAVPLAPPTGARVFALPGATVARAAGGAVIDATNNAGVSWDRELANAVTADAAVLYHVWAAGLGNGNAPTNPLPGDFRVLTQRAPLPVSRSILSPPQTPPTPADWPPVPLHYIHRGLPDGWYGYRVSGIDIFGRHSAQSASAAWYQWSPAPDPRPWYYIDPPADRRIHPSAVRLLDKLPPPPPPGVEAFALDPADPHVQHDAAWQAWFDSLSGSEKTSVIGLRVRWRWLVAQQRQAPDTREFRIYDEPAPLNTLRGRVTSIAAASATETDVVTDIANASASSFAGLSMRIGADSFAIVTSQAGTPLRVRVRNIGPQDDVRPAERTRCAVALGPGHALYEDTSTPAVWQDRLLVVPYANNVTIDADGNRTYEVFMPVPASANREGLPLTTTLDEPLAAAAIGVTAADDKVHTPDHRGDAARFGNESRIGGPATVFRVRREKPAAPAVPAEGGKLYASVADYHAHSFFTYRWLPGARLKSLVYRALDDGVFQADLARRPRPALNATDLPFFPDETAEPAWDAAKRTQIAADLNALNAVDRTDRVAVRTAYGALSNDALRVLAGLPGTERVFVQLMPQALDPDEPDATAPGGLRWRRVGPDVDAGSLAAGQRAYVDTLDGRATNRYFYRCAYVDEVQNVGAMSISSPPVWLPDVTPPAPPRVVSVAAGDRQITLAWSSNREADLAEYRVYRTADANRSRDIRLMDLVHTAAVAAGDPSARPAVVTWTDNPVPGLRDLWYRLVAVDRVDPDPRAGGGNVSSPSPAMRTRAYDQTPPDPPAITTLEWVRVDPAGAIHAWSEPVPPGAEWLPVVRLAWAAPAEPMKLLVQISSDSDPVFRPASRWLPPGTVSYLHPMTRTFENHTYRLKAVSEAGNANVDYHPRTLVTP